MYLCTMCRFPVLVNWLITVLLYMHTLAIQMPEVRKAMSLKKQNKQKMEND